MCECDVCKQIDKKRWETIEKCPCYCHDVEHPAGHDSLCCAYPNGKRKDNPHKQPLTP